MINYLKNVLEKMPKSWLSTTTHRLDIYDEKLAKTEFLEQFELLSKKDSTDPSALNNLPTAYDYIRLGHPLSCVLEWSIARLHEINPKNIISFSSQTIPILSILRKNLLAHINTRIIYTDNCLDFFDYETIKQTYGYSFELKKVEKLSDISDFDGTTVLVSQSEKVEVNTLKLKIDFFINIYKKLGSVLIVNGKQNEHYISEIQHVRRRETIAMTPANCHTALLALIKNSTFTISSPEIEFNKKIVR